MDTDIIQKSYSASKAAGEELNIAYSNTYPIPSLITHCCNVYGYRQNWKKFIPNTIKKFSTVKSDCTHRRKQRTQSRYYIHNKDLADSIVYLTKNHQKVRSESIKMYNNEPAKINITGESLITI